jgi:hypothetical protein
MWSQVKGSGENAASVAQEVDAGEREARQDRVTSRDAIDPRA